MLKNQTAAPLWFANAVQAVVSKERLREEKKSRLFEAVSLSEISLLWTGAFWQSELSTATRQPPSEPHKHFHFPFSSHLPVSHCFHGLQNNQLQSPFFSLVSRILTNCVPFDDCLIIPFHLCRISNWTSPSSFPLRVHLPLFCLSACRRLRDTSDFYWLNTDLLRHARLRAAAPVKPSVCCFLSAEHVAL